MGYFQSLGVHKPASLPYLIAEGVLPENPARHLYQWEIYTESDPDGVEDEIVATDTHVVWSRGDIIQKVFNFDIEKQKVVQALLTWFPADDTALQSQSSSQSDASKAHTDVDITETPKKTWESRSAANTPNKKQHGSEPQTSTSTANNLSRALVVLLKHQAHVYFLSGSSHVVNLPFEVERAFASPRGLVLQRKVQPLEKDISSPAVPKAPQNSFFSSQIGSQGIGPNSSQTRQPSFTRHSFTSVRGGRSRMPSGAHSFLLDDLAANSRRSANQTMPRLFSLTDPMSEIGLVVTENQDVGDLRIENTDKSEQLLYISPCNELQEYQSPKDAPLILVVTVNYESRMFTVWHAYYLDKKPAASYSRRRSSGAQKKRMSYAATTGANTPALRPRECARESLNIAKRSKTVPGSFANSGIHSRDPASTGQAAEDDLASQLDPEFGITRQPKESRRVSSLLARTELSNAHDRTTFQDLASTHDGHGNLGRRGTSFGAPDRTSFGAGYARHRMSSQNFQSRLSLDVASVDTSVADLTLNGDTPTSETFDAMDLDPNNSMDPHEALDGLRKELVMTKFSQTSMDDPSQAPIFTAFASDNERRGDIKVFAIKKPLLTTTGLDGDTCYLYLSDVNHHIVSILSYDLRRERLSSTALSITKQPMAGAKYALVPCNPRWTRNKDFIDLLKIEDQGIFRLVGLRKDDHGQYHFRVVAPWCSDLEVIYHPVLFKAHNPYTVPNGLVTPTKSGAGRRRTLTTPEDLKGLILPSADSCFDVIDEEDRTYRFTIPLAPHNETVRRVLDVCQLILPEFHVELLMTAWWTMINDSKDQSTGDVDEWQCLVSALFCLFVPFVDRSRAVARAEILKPLKEAEKLHTRLENPMMALGKSQSRFDDSSPWNQMWKIESQRPGAKFWNNPMWNWCKPNPAVEARASQHAFIPSCIKNADRFFDMNETYRETLRKDPPYQSEANSQAPDTLPRLLVGLHLIYEEQKLSVLNRDRVTTCYGNLGLVLAQMGHWLRSMNWGFHSDYYQRDKVGNRLYDFEDSRLNPPCTSVGLLNDPPSVIDWINDSLMSEHEVPFLTLGGLFDPRIIDSLTKPSRLVQYCTPRTFALMRYFSKLHMTDRSDAAKVETMATSGITVHMLETFPDSLSIPLREVMVSCESSPPTTWSNDLLRFVGREDLEMPFQQVNQRSDSHLPLSRTSVLATNNIHAICQSTEEPEPARASSEADRFAITRLLFSEDQRFLTAARLLEPLKAPVAECHPDPSWSEAEYLEAQKEVMQYVMIRTFALPAGQGMLLYSSKKPLITEKFPLHGFTTVCIMQPMGNHVSADRTNYTEEKYSWAFFHAGVSAGLAISRDAEGIDTSWIMFNKPAELHNRHAGLLLSLGLNGHLKTIAKWLSFKYLTPKHTMTTIGLLLGLSASYIGTMDPLVTRLLSVHVTRMLPAGAAELNLSPLTQTTGLMGIGLLYCDTQHRRMSEVMLSEIEHIDVDDPAVAAPQTDNLRDEGYRLAAGFALGYINLGKGKDLKGLHDMRLLERLLSMAVGPRPINMVQFLDRATAGATVAIALIFMKTGNRSVANKIDIPDTIPQFDYVRPDMFLLRTLAKHLILWDDIEGTKEWIMKNIPSEYRDLHNLKSIRSLKTDHMPFYNIIAGLLFSVALKYAGSGDTKVRDFLIRYLDQYIRIASISAVRYDARITRNYVRNCQDLIALSVATVMAGMGDLDVLRRLRLLHGRVGPEIPYGSHLAAHMALGILFLGGGVYTLGTSNLAIASLICAFYPLYPSSVLDNKAHLQAFRHFWVLAASPRCLVVRDFDTRRSINLPIVLTLKDSSVTETTAPTLLPSLETIATIRTNSPEFWQVTLDFVHNPAHVTAFATHQTLWVRRRPPSDAHGSVFSAALSALNAAQQPPATLAPATTAAGFQILAEGRWDWILQLRTFRTMFNREDWAAVLPIDPSSSLALSGDTTAVDTRLGLYMAIEKGMKVVALSDREEMHALSVWLEWAEDALDKGKRLRFIGKDAVAQLRKDSDTGGVIVSYSRA